MRPSLTKLVAQIGEIIGQSGDDSHSGTTQSQSDGGLRVRLRTVLLSLLDGIMGNGNTAATPAGKEVASMLKLLTITLTRSSSLLVDGDGGTSLLPEVLERLLPLLTRPQLAELHGEVADIVCRILSLLAGTAPGLAAALARGTLTLFEDVFDVACVLSTQPELSASVACYASALRSTDSAEPPLQLQLDGPAACECLLVGVLRMLGHSLRLRPLALGAVLGPLPLEHARTLLLGSSTSLQAGAMQLLAVALDGAPLAPCSPTLLLDTLAVMLQRRGRVQPAPEADKQAQRQEWWQALAALLRVLADRATADTAAAAVLLPRVLSLAAASAAALTGDAALQLSFCQLCRAALLAQPTLFEGCCASLLQLFPAAAPACRCVLAECVALYLHHQGQLCGGAALGAAVGQAITAAGLAAEAAPAAPADPGEEGRSARKRRRVRVSPLRASQQAPASEQAHDLHPPGPGLAAVATALAQLAAQLAEGCRQHPPAADGASALALLLGVLSPLAPRKAVAIGMDLLPPALQQGAASRWHALSGDSGQLTSLLHLMLASLEAALVSAAGQGDTAAAALSPLPPPQVLAALQRAWVADGSSEAMPAATAAVPPSGSSRVAAMCACLAAVQADLLDPSDMLDLLQRELKGHLQPTEAGSDGSSSAAAAATAAAMLLPAACVIGAARERPLASQPRATQGGRRQKQAQALQAHPPSPLVAALHKLLSSAGEAPPAGLSFAAAAAQQQRRHAVLAALAGGLLCVVGHAQDPLHLALAAIDAASSGSGGASSWALWQMLQRPLAIAAEAERHLSTLSSGVSEWVRLALERLTAAQLPAEGQAVLVDAVAVFLQRAAQSQLEYAKPLVQWLIGRATSQQAAVRNAVLRQAVLFAEPQVILALCHEGEHPVHTKDRQALVEALEHQMLQALREKLEALEAPAAGGGRSASGMEAIREGLVQILGCVGSRMRSPTANQLLLGIMIVQLDKWQPVRAVAAEVLQGIAEQRKAPLRELVCASQKFLAFLARNVRDNAELTAELADILGVAPRGLVIMVMPQALPIMMAEQNREGLEMLAQQAGVSLHRLLQEYGHCVIARELFEGAPNFDSLIEFAESITGQDSVEFLSRSIGATVKELVTEAGGAEDWGAGVALPDVVLQRCSMMLGELADMYYKCSGVSVAEFLAEGDHATRMLKHWGDLLDRRLPPPALLALWPSAGDTSQHAQQQAGSHSQAASAAQPHMAPADVRACITTLRCILLLTRLTGRFIGRFLPQLMVLLTAGVRPANPREVKLQCLEGWLGLVRALAQEAPVQLGGVVNQVVVALLESLQEGGPVSAAAIRALEELVLICRRTHREKLRYIPPLPNWLPELEKLNETLAKERGKLSTQEQIELLVASLADESLAVRATALRELRSVLSSRREWALGLLGAAGGAASAARAASSGGGAASLLSRLMSALLKCCDPEVHSQTSLQAQQACAECLGILGAVDPARVAVELQPPAQRCTSDGDLLVTLITRHLVRLLKTAPNLQVLDGATLAIQELLRSYSRADGLQELAAQQATQGGSRQAQGQASRETSPADSGVAEGNLLFAALAPEVQAIVRPYLDSKYHIRGVAQRPRTVLFGSAPGMSMRQWLFLWFSQLVQHHASGNQLKLFQSVMPACRFDIPTCLFLMPYLLHNVLAHGTDDARQSVQQEIQAVLAGSSMSREGTLCCQAVFSLLDTLQKWHGDAKAAAQLEQQQLAANEPARAGESGQHVQLSPQWDCIEQLLEAMPKQLLAQAASQCGAHARSLQYFETHVRTLHSGALNPAAHRSASYSDAEVSYLQEVYGKLEDPDGLQGLVRLRQGGPRPEDQRLAAEKAGNWSEALTLYEQALQHSQGSGGDSTGVGTGGGGHAAGPGAVAGLLDSGGGGSSGRGSAAGREAGLGPMQRGYLDCLLHMGHLQGLLTQVEGLAGEASPSAAGQLAALGAAASWRLGQWERVKGYAEIASQTYSQLDADARWEVRMARLLWSVAHRDFDALQRDLQRARSEVMGPFSAAAMESYSRAYPHLVKLHMLQEIADVAGGLQRGQGPLERHRALRWDERLAAAQSSLSTQEPILALRRQLAALSGAAEQAGECWLQLAQLCRGTGHYEAATTAVLEAVASRVPRAPLEHVQLLWDKGQPYRAISEATVLLSQAQEHRLAAPFAHEAEHSRFHAQAALQLAQWMAETGQAAQDEITALFDRAITLEPKSETVLFHYAVFLDELMSDARARQEAEKERGEKRKGMDRLVGNARIKLGEDRPFLEILPDVIKSYGMSLQHGSEHSSQSLPRMLTLWFEFGTYLHTFRKGQQPSVKEQQAVAAATQAITAIMTNLAKRVPKSTWLAALPQLISRMCHPCKEVSELARHIIILITQAYPHQSLWSLAAVAKSSVAARRAAAAAITNAAKKNMDQRIFAEMASFSDQLIRLATHQPAKGRTMSARKEFSHLVRSMPLRNVVMPAMSCLSITLPPVPGRGGGAQPAAPQPELVTVESIVDTIDVMASLQKPKKVTFVGSDGAHYTFLAKPKDDLRKDNRMMEAAGVVNRLFAGDPAARRRNLYLRRFAVLPIGEDNGIVEWVPNTRGMRHCLADIYASAGLYEGHRTNRAIQRIWDGSPQSRRRAEVLDEVLQNWPPLFHRWQLGNFTEPAAWLNARLAYTRTAGVWSMVGHVVGLGDRHGENILIDCSNGDIVHVDFSCLFDKGLTLAKPEMVPFRLTQNVIDGFGVSGVEGLYRRVCEITLDVLRSHRGSILSHIDTFVHDPLVEWVRSSSNNGNGNGGSKSAAVNDEGGDNPHAKDALATIEGRLKGTLLGVRSVPCMPLSVEGQAHRLIEEASSKENLGMMYIWWMPWM